MRGRTAVLVVAWILCFYAPASAQMASVAGQLEIPRRSELPLVTHRHGAAVVRDRLYILGGGTTTGWTAVVRSAPVFPDGQLGEWRGEVPLPEFRTYIGNGTVAVGNRLYVVAGNTNSRANAPDPELKKTQDVLWTEVDAEGHLAPWRRSTAFPGLPLSCVGACSDGQYLVVVGGSTDRDISDQILLARLAPSGEPVEWRIAGRTPTPIWFHGAGLVGSRLYCWGGLTQRDRSSVNSRVFSISFNDGGLEDSWRVEASMPAAVYSAAFVAGGGHLLCIGGRYANTYPTNVIWASRLGAEGVLAPWQMFKTDLDAWVSHAAAFDSRTGVVFITGGSRQTSPGNPSELLTTVQAFRLAEPAP